MELLYYLLGLSSVLRILLKGSIPTFFLYQVGRVGGSKESPGMKVPLQVRGGSRKCGLYDVSDGFQTGASLNRL